MKSDHRLWYAEEAAAWTEALPIGNGRLGAMVFGGTRSMRFALNEDTLWSGYPRQYAFPNAQAALQKAQEALRENDYAAAQDLLERDFAGPDCQSYLPLGDLILSLDEADISAYSRYLDIERGLAGASFCRNGAPFEMECFASYPDGGIVIRLAAQAPFRAAARMGSPLKSHAAARENGLLLTGLCPNNNVPQDTPPDDPALCPEEQAHCGMRFCAMVKAETDGICRAQGDFLQIENATRLEIRLTARTSFAGPDRHPQLEGRDEIRDCAADMARLEKQSYQALKARHVADFSGLMNRLDFSLGADIPNAPTPARLKNRDPALYELIFQFGRYLMISASRPGSQAMNLQGIWNESVTPPWHSDYTVNINTEMNYWPAEPLNLSEMHEPLFSLLTALRKTGAEAASALYGAGGMTAHHNIDLWAHATPVSGGRVGIAQWSFWPMSAAWMSRHLFDHYLYTLDRAFLSETALPVLRDCAQFFADTLQTDARGLLSVSPATSPENVFLINGKRQAVAKSAAMSNAIVRELFQHYLQAARILALDEPLIQRVQALLPLIKPIETGEDGRLLEWDADYEETEKGHRHVSHLYPLHPAHQITPEHTPALAQAARRTLETRGDAGTGWSLGWKINFWARLQEGDHALGLLNMQLRYVDNAETDYHNGGGTYANLFDAHPPFQIDGNFGASAGIGEMLLQSRPGEILILPARPGAWRHIEVSGLRAMGNTEVDIRAQDDAVTVVLRVHTPPETPISILYQGRAVQTLKDAGTYTLNL